MARRLGRVGGEEGGVHLWSSKEREKWRDGDEERVDKKGRMREQT